MALILDTNVAIHLRDGDSWTVDRIEAVGSGIFMSVITRVELEGGVVRGATYDRTRRARLDEMLSAIPCLSFGDEAAQIYGTIIRENGYSRRKILDRMIAAQAVLHRMDVATFNADDFREVNGLSVLDWAKERDAS